MGVEGGEEVMCGKGGLGGVGGWGEVRGVGRGGGCGEWREVVGGRGGVVGVVGGVGSGGRCWGCWRVLGALGVRAVLGVLGLVGAVAVSSGVVLLAAGDGVRCLGGFQARGGGSRGYGRENCLQESGRVVASLKMRWLQEEWVSGRRFWVSWA